MTEAEKILAIDLTKPFWRGRPDGHTAGTVPLRLGEAHKLAAMLDDVERIMLASPAFCLIKSQLQKARGIIGGALAARQCPHGQDWFACRECTTRELVACGVCANHYRTDRRVEDLQGEERATAEREIRRHRNRNGPDDYVAWARRLNGADPLDILYTDACHHLAAHLRIRARRTPPWNEVRHRSGVLDPLIPYAYLGGGHLCSMKCAIALAHLEVQRDRDWAAAHKIEATMASCRRAVRNSNLNNLNRK